MTFSHKFNSCNITKVVLLFVGMKNLHILCIENTMKLTQLMS